MSRVIVGMYILLLLTTQAVCLEIEGHGHDERIGDWLLSHDKQKPKIAGERLIRRRSITDTVDKKKKKKKFSVDKEWRPPTRKHSVVTKNGQN